MKRQLVEQKRQSNQFSHRNSKYSLKSPVHDELQSNRRWSKQSKMTSSQMNYSSKTSDIIIPNSNIFDSEDRYTKFLERKVIDLYDNQKIVSVYTNLQPSKIKLTDQNVSISSDKNFKGYFRKKHSVLGGQPTGFNIRKSMAGGNQISNTLATPKVSNVPRQSRNSVFRSQMSYEPSPSNARKVFFDGNNNYRNQQIDIEEKKTEDLSSSRSKSVISENNKKNMFQLTSLDTDQEKQYKNIWFEHKKKLKEYDRKLIYHRSAKTSLHQSPQQSNRTTKVKSFYSTQYQRNANHYQFHKKDHKRVREFHKLQLSQKLYLDGMPQGTYDISIIRDQKMQTSLIQDLLSVLLEKMQSIKYIIHNYDKTRRIFLTLTPIRKGEFNEKFEQTIIAVEYISYQILKDFRDDLQDLGINESPIQEYKELQIEFEKDMQEKIDQEKQKQLDMLKLNYYQQSNIMVQENSGSGGEEDSDILLDTSKSKMQESIQQQQQMIQSQISKLTTKKQQSHQQQPSLQKNSNEPSSKPNSTIDQSQEDSNNLTQEQQILKSRLRNLNKFYANHMQLWEEEKEKTQGILKPRQYKKIDVAFEDEEIPVFDDNMYLFLKILDFYKDCLDVFRIMCRQRTNFAFMNEIQCQRMLNVIVQSRINIGFLYEELKILDKKMQEKEKFNKILEMGLLHQASSLNQQTKIQEKELEREIKRKSGSLDLESHKKKVNDKNKQLKAERLKQLISQKYLPKNISVNMDNQNYQQKRLEQDTELLRLSYQKDFKIDDIADNRRRLRLKNMQSQFGSQEIQSALRIARTIPNIKIPHYIIKNA